jgi:G2/mitotic-specific cyclin 1/2
MYIAAISAAPSTVTTTQPQALEQVVEVCDEDAMAMDEQPTAAAQLTPKTIQSVASSRRVQVQEQEEDAEATRVFKKRRTSSKAPVSEAQMFEEQVDLAADPKGDEWEDLDAEDADDPLVVSEHVVEIFKYMKEVEVSFNFSTSLRYLICS